MTQKELVDPEDYILEDRASENKFGMKLSTSIARARANRGHLLRGVPIYCTTKVRNGADTFAQIALANRATWKIYDGKSITIKPTTREQDGGRPPEPVYLLTSNSPEERKLFAGFRKMASDGNMEPRIVSPDWLLDVCMKQHVSFDKKYLVPDEPLA